MKYLAAIALLASGAAAFAPTALVSRTSALSMAPAGGSPAASHEEDLDKTYKVCAVCAVSEGWGINECMMCWELEWSAASRSTWPPH